MCCEGCGSVLSTCVAPSRGVEGAWCRTCGGTPRPVDLPHSLRYLVAQLASVNIALKIQLTP